jgi:hypothetical protein
MTEQNPPTWIQGGTHPAEGLRRMIHSLMSNGEGVIYPTNLAVTERAAGANMSVDVAGGRAFVLGDEATYQGTYHIENRGVVNLTLSASDATHTRLDLIVAQVEDSAYSGGTDAWSLAVVEGTPDASPAIPATPDNALALGYVTVGAMASSISTGNFTDQRGFSAMWKWWIGRGASTWSNPFSSGVTVGNGTYEEVWFQTNADMVTCRLTFELGTTSAITGPIVLALPLDPADNDGAAGHIGIFKDSGTSVFYNSVSSNQGSSAEMRALATGGTYTALTAVGATVPFTWATGDKIMFTAHYQATTVLAQGVRT